MKVTDQAHIAALYRYPVKGLSPEPLSATMLAPGQTVPADRLYAIENGPSGFDPAKPGYLPKQRFLMLMRNERLARLRTRFDDATHTLHIAENGVEAVTADLRTQDGRAAVEAFFAGFSADELRGPPKVLQADGHSFSDVAKKVVSIINLASVAAVEDIIGAPVDPLRFRANVYVRGWAPWSEQELMGQTVVIGETRLKVVKHIVRCAATNVDPRLGVRDMNIPLTLEQHYGNMHCGVYAEVTTGGPIAVGDAIGTA
jgi:uncharacterized protein YcbX